MDDLIKQLLQYYAPMSCDNVNSVIDMFGDDIHDDETFIFIVVAVEREHEGRWGNGEYDNLTQNIQTQMRNIEKQYGLDNNEYFSANDMPDEYKKLNDKYHSIYRLKLEAVFMFTWQNNSQFIEAYLKHKKKNKRLKAILSLTLSQLLCIGKDACLYPFEQGDERFKDLMSIVNYVRNLVHPGRRVSTGIHVCTEQEFKLVNMIYLPVKEHYFNQNSIEDKNSD